MSLKDLFLGPIYFFIILMIANSLKNRLAKTEEEKDIYMKALMLKMFGVTFFAFIYEFYYGGGDTMGFYTWSEAFVRFLFNDFSSAISFLFSNDEATFLKFKYNYYPDNYGYLFQYGTREVSFIKMTSVINLIGLNSYLSTSYLFALISFVGNWLLYRVFISYYPLIKKQLAFATLYIPSVAFWGTGILKDTFTFAALGFLVYSLYKIFVKNESILRSVFLTGLSIYIIMILKAYIFLAFLPAGVLWIFNEKKANIKSDAIRAILTPFFIVMMVLTLFGLVALIGSSAGRFSADNLEQTTKDFQGWHQVASENGSGYVIHNTGTSIGSLVAAFPESIVVTYFRPFLWESGSIVVLMGAVESLILFLYFLKVFLYKGKVFLFFRAIFSKPIIQMCLVFALFFGFVVGFTSFNFGALARYKIPSMPFFVAFLVMVSHQIDILSGKIKQE